METGDKYQGQGCGNLIIFHEITQPVPNAVRNLAPSAIQKGGHLITFDIFNRRNDIFAFHMPEFDLGNTPSTLNIKCLKKYLK